MGKATAIRDLFKIIGRAFRGPVRAPRPMPHPTPVRPRPAPAPPPRKPPTPQPRRPVPPPPDVWSGTQTDPQPEPGTGLEGQTETQGGPKAGDEPECKTCPDCLAREAGTLVPNHYGSVTEAAHRGYAYQHFVCPWHAHVPSANLIQEWQFSEVDFDGLHPVECLLLEAKHGYDGFLEMDGWDRGDRPKMKDWLIKAGKDPFHRARKQSKRHNKAVLPFWPDLQIKWVFSELITLIYLRQYFLDNGFVIIDTEHRPWKGNG